MSETQLRETVARFGKSIFYRGLAFGSTGNISLRFDVYRCAIGQSHH